jgi:HSP20 family molecular chaperone IbpA
MPSLPPVVPTWYGRCNPCRIFRPASRADGNLGATWRPGNSGENRAGADFRGRHEARARNGTAVAFSLRQRGPQSRPKPFKEDIVMNNSIAYSPNKWLDQFFNDFDKVWSNKNDFTPAVDIVEEKEDYVLRAELPGVAKEDIKVEVKENRLTLSGKKANQWQDKGGEYRYVESSYGSFARAFEIPRNVSGEAIKA